MKVKVEIGDELDHLLHETAWALDPTESNKISRGDVILHILREVKMFEEICMMSITGWLKDNHTEDYNEYMQKKQ